MVHTKSRFWPFAQGSAAVIGTAAILAVGATALWVTWPHLLVAFFALLFVFILLFLLYFLRDPERQAPPGDNLLVSPADGQVIAIEPVQEPLFLKGPATRISIFMSVTNVHVNRAPLAGTVRFTEHRPGRFLKAYRPEASELNECHFIGLEQGDLRITVKQVAGIMARRIVCWASVGQPLARGQRFGLIKLGSRVDLFLPPHVEVLVKLQQKVRAGETIVAQIPDQSIAQTAADPSPRKNL